jgi:transposase insI for insertion sequence element IS30B/C/D
MEKVVRKLNNRPRKCLQWITPDEAHLEEALHLI